MKKILSILVMLFFVSSAAFAQPPGKGPKGKGPKWKEKGPTTIEEKGEAVGEAVIEAVTEEILEIEGEVETPKGMPPGLSKKGKMPPGLAKKEKIPAGWSKGEKKGWDKDATVEGEEGSVLKKAIRALFKRQKAE